MVFSFLKAKAAFSSLIHNRCCFKSAGFEKKPPPASHRQTAEIQRIPRTLLPVLWMLGAATSLTMANDVSAIELDSIDWDTEDELEVFGAQDPSSSNPSTRDNPLVNGEVVQEHLEANTSAGSSNGKLIEDLVKMGFKEDLVYRVIEETGKDADELESIVETLLTYSSPEGSQFLESSSEELRAFDKSPEEQRRKDYNYILSSSDYEECGFSDTDVWSDNELEENPDRSSEKDKMLRSLAKMGYSLSEASIALERCGPDASISELTDCICAHQFAREQDLELPDDKPRMRPSNGECGKLKKRKMFAEMYNSKKMRGSEFVEELLRLPNPMVGFGLPSHPDCVTQRTLPEKAIGPPYFYYENVAMTPKGVWDTISKFLYGVDPEFVDSKYFCAAARKRGYVHNLPIHNRFPLIPAPPFTIHDAFPLTRRWWPKWDTRTKLNCLQTAIGSAKLQERIRKAIEDYEGDPPLDVQKYVMDQCRKWNLVWVGRNKVAPLEPDEVEILLGFPKNHTRGGGTSRTERYKSLGNSFQVDTVAYHLSVLKPLFPNGMNVLSLFSGIGGAEVALHRLGIPLNNVVSVEKSEVNQNIVRCWWEQTNQKGNLIHLDDVQVLDREKLESLIASVGGFDLVVGGSPCNNLAGSNRVSRDGLEGKESSLFYDYFRILEDVKTIMARRR